MPIFFLIGSILWTLAHIYVGFRTIETFNFSRTYKNACWTIFLLSGATFVVAVLSRRTIDLSSVHKFICSFGYIWGGIFVMVLMATVARDLTYAIISLIAFMREVVTGKSATDLQDPSKRQLFSSAVSLGIFAAAGGASAIGYRQATKIPDLKPVDVPIKNLDPRLEGFTIVQLSDIHVGQTIKGEFLDAVVRRVNEVGADMVALTGDFVDGYVDDLRNETKYLARIKARHGLFYCTGNHEYYWDGPGWCAEVARLGGTVLVDSHTTFESNGATVLVAGVADYSMKRGTPPEGHNSSPIDAMRGAPPHDVSILLAHQPKSVYEAVEAGFDLQLSGHTHGGQFWPWNYIVGLAHPLCAGLGKFENTQLYVSRGTGFWGPPNRFLVPSEITVLRLVAAS